MIEKSNRLPAPTKKCLDSLLQYGYIWDYEHCYVNREISSKSIIINLEIDAKYNNFKIHISKTKNWHNAFYSISIYYKDLQLFPAKKAHNLHSVGLNCIYITKLLDKMKNKEIISSIYFLEKDKKFTVFSCKDDMHLIFVRDTGFIFNYNDQEFIGEVYSKNIKILMRSIKLIDRL